MRGGILAALILSLIATASDAALLGRTPVTPGGTDYQAYYDTVLNITWVANGNLAWSKNFGIPGITNSNAGRMSWSTAQTWLAALNAENYLGGSNWRMPAWTDTGSPGVTCSYSGSDCGYNVDLNSSEMAHMYYSTLGNPAKFSNTGSPTPGCSIFSYSCLANTGPFVGLQHNDYWTGTPAPTTGYAWYFGMWDGQQRAYSMGTKLYVWAVHSGDIGNPVPIPAAAWLFDGALGALGVLKRRAKSAA